MNLEASSESAAVACDAPLGLYVHIPFCEKKCPYCDFNTYAGLGSLHASMVDALCAEMSSWRDVLKNRSLSSVFLGGGTPTVLDAQLLDRLMGAVYDNFSLAAQCEITSEANPGTVDRRKFTCLRDLGVNRLSLGVQSFQPSELQFLGRIHDVEDVFRAVDGARSAGFDNINLDFIFGLPGQSDAAWHSTLDQALQLAPEHLSLYSLIVEPGTPLFRWVESGQVAEPDEDCAAGLFEIALARLEAAGYDHYEVSNWAKGGDAASSAAADDAATPLLASRHNLLYWRNQEYLGIGPGAHSHLRLPGPGSSQRSRRWGNCKPPRGYIRRIESGESVEEDGEEIGERLSMGESMMLGLRLVREGVPFASFRALHLAEMQEVFATELAQLQTQEMIEMDGRRVRLTQRGLMVGNQVFLRFLPDSEAVV